MIMQRLFFFFVACVLLPVHAQKPLYNDLGKGPKVMNYQEVDLRPLHFGFSLGFNTMDFLVRQSAQNIFYDSLTADVTRLYPGFNVNIITDARLHDYWSIRFLPGLIFGQRNLTYWKKESAFDSDMKLESNLLDFPLLIKYKAKRINNYRPYMIGGGSLRLDMAAKKKYDEDEEVYVKLKKLDYYYEFGFGIDFYSVYFKFSTEFKMSVGLRNVLTDKPDPHHPEYVNAIERLNSSIFQLSMHFE